MRIISRGSSTPEQELTCYRCGTVFVFDKSDVRTETNRVYTDPDTKDKYYFDTVDYYVYCPHCGNKMAVSAWAKDW